VAFMYSGSLRLSPDTAEIMLLVATQLDITAVVQLCQTYIENQRDPDLSAAREHTACNPEDGDTQNREVVSVVQAHKSPVKTEQAGSADNSVSAALICLPATQTDTSGSSGQKLQSEESTKSSQGTKSPVASGHGQTSVGRNHPSRCRKLGYTTQTGVTSLALEQSLSVLSAGSRTEDDPDWTSDSGPATHRYNTRKRSRLSDHKPMSSSGLEVQTLPRKQPSSSSDETLCLRIARKRPSSSASNQTAASAAVYRLPAWQRSRRILLAARMLLVRRIKVTDGGRFQCRQCEVEGFASRSHLGAHVLSRHQRRHRCFSCGWSFTSFVAVVRHVRIKHRYFPRSRLPGKKVYTAESPSHERAAASVHNKCGWCGQKFAARSKLLEHRQAVHRRRGEATPPVAVGRRVMRDWQCSEKDCGAEFKYKDKLRVHMAEQHPNVIFCCPECRFKTQVEHFLKRYCSHIVYFPSSYLAVI